MRADLTAESDYADASHVQQQKHGAPERSAIRAGSRVGWYILRCGGGRWTEARDALMDRGYGVFVPTERKWRPRSYRKEPEEVSFPRFPGYLFLHATPPHWPAWQAWPLSRWTWRILTMAGNPVRLADVEIDRLMLEDGTPVPPASADPLHRAFQAGQQVRVRRGGFRDRVTRLNLVDDRGGHITVDLLGRQVQIALPLQWIEAA